MSNSYTLLTGMWIQPGGQYPSKTLKDVRILLSKAIFNKESHRNTWWYWKQFNKKIVYHIIFFLIGKNWKTQNVLKLGILGGKFDRPKMGSNVAVIMLYHARDISKRIPMIILPWGKVWGWVTNSIGPHG